MEWLEHKWRFRLLFTPIMNLKSSTSILGDRVLFELQVSRGNDPFRGDILPLEADFHQDQSVAKEPVEAVLLNPKPLEPIRANSAYQFVWQLPTSKIGKSIPITHYIHLRYRMEQQQLHSNGRAGDGDGLAREITGRDYAFDNTLTFAVQKVEYEVCAHVLSDKPQLVLCRIDLPCDLIVSLRSLTSNKESIIVVVEVDQEYWNAVDRCKGGWWAGRGWFLSKSKPKIFSGEHKGERRGPDQLYHRAEEGGLPALPAHLHPPTSRQWTECNEPPPFSLCNSNNRCVRCRKGSPLPRRTCSVSA